MFVDLLIGFPDQRPGGLALTLISAFSAASAAAAVGALYGSICVAFPRATLLLQALLAALRGTPLILILFFLVQLTDLPLALAGFMALALYSVSHVGETLRGFLSAYPLLLRDQARVMGMGGVEEWLRLRLPWTFRQSLAALGTHWISLLKDTGALTVLGIGELTTVARVLSERVAFNQWLGVLALAAGLYLLAALALIRVLDLVMAKTGSSRGLVT
jgi:ABC-type amino acid transport system permease subunit